MDIDALIKLFNELLKFSKEKEWVEFKEAKTDYDFDKLGKYFSAICNEANLNHQQCGWLVFGVVDKTRKVCGTNYRRSGKYTLDALKKEVADKTTGRISFADIYELPLTEGRVVMFKIPPAPRGIPIAWCGHYYGREGESLAPLSLSELDGIRIQNKHDWSEQICSSASLSDLESKALLKAREEYKKTHMRLAQEVDKWSDETFLNKTRLSINDKLTRAAIILLGKPEAENHISPGIARISWILKDDNNIEKDYEHFGPPFILNTDEVLTKIRNLKYRYIPNQTLFPMETMQYETYVIREALHNCIAHQNYELRSRIVVVELPEQLIFTNSGSFLPGSIENVIEQDAPQKFYRNHLLATAMADLNMIDTVGGGIKKMFLKQRERYFPLPTYILNRADEVTVKIYGKIMDENYTKLLMKRTDLNLSTIMLIDRVQKKEKVSTDAIRYLRTQKLVEGRSPNIYLTSQLASTAGDKAGYIKNRAFDKEHYKKMIIAFIEKFSSATRKDIDNLLLDKLSDVLNEKQKRNRIRNLMYEMSKKNRSIKNSGTNKCPKWVLL
ncbi:MAG: RNA-binding domain-containing protein [Elusimicrobiota bacterium]